MIDKFKNTYDALFPKEPKTLSDTIEIYEYLNPHWLIIKEALTLATETEQLRKERDELKSALQSIVKEADINALTLYHTLEGGFKYMAGKVTEINFKAQKALKG